ncbi:MULTISPECIES: hypothetical protein [Rhodococcus]|uniref:hypothetical protein n=1 Tax=Rhodococcus TaxID=1827 RepID=UPI00071806B2|nr:MULTISPECIES: hypothetical protein [Rhodococcus]MEA1798298.1 hypothetical protein [Rhodococcus qingshengii]
MAACVGVVTLLAIAVFQQFADSGQNIGIGLLRGAEDTTSSFKMTLIGYWEVGLPVGLLCAHGLDLKAPGMWIGLSCGLLTAAVLLLRTFTKRLHTIETQAVT